MNYFNVGKIVNTQGLQGEMRVLSVTDFAEERFKKGAELALFDENDQFVRTVVIAEENLNDLDEGEFYYHEIIGLEVYEGDNLIGTIKEILQPGANDVWVVKRKGKRDLLLPYIPPVVLNIDIPNNRVDVELLEGLDDED